MHKSLFIMLVTLISAPSIGLAQPTLDDLFRAVRLGNTAEVQKLLIRGMDVNSTDPGGNSILMEATREGKPEVVSLLIGRKVRVNAQNAVGDTAIMIGALTGRYEIVQQLRKAGAQLDQPGWTPLHYAAFGGHVRICQYLIAQGAPVNAPAPNGTTPLMMAVREGHAEAAKALLEARADPNAKTDTGRTALQWASAAGNSEILEMLKRAGAKE